MVSIDGVIGFLEDWLQHHIAVTDHAYVAQMRLHRELVDAASTNLLNNLGAIV